MFIMMTLGQVHKYNIWNINKINKNAMNVC